MSSIMSARGRQVVREAVANAIKRLVRSGTETVPALADRLGKTKATIQRWADGDGYPAYTAAVLIAPQVGIDPMTGRPVS